MIADDGSTNLCVLSAIHDKLRNAIRSFLQIQKKLELIWKTSQQQAKQLHSDLSHQISVSYFGINIASKSQPGPLGEVGRRSSVGPAICFPLRTIQANVPWGAWVAQTTWEEEMFRRQWHCRYLGSQIMIECQE